MGVPNLTLRGTIYWWRRRITVSGHLISLAISLRTGIFHQARIRAGHLSAEVEKLRMAYGDCGTAIDKATAQKIFNDAMRSQLDRIEQCQIGSPADPADHALVNGLWAELYRIFAREDQRWTADDDERLEAAGWSDDARALLADLWEVQRHERLIPLRQLATYQTQLGYRSTLENNARVERIIYSAKAAACDEATRRLGSRAGDMPGWAEAALTDTGPFLFEGGGRAQDLLAEDEAIYPPPALAGDSLAEPTPPNEAADKASVAARESRGPRKSLKQAAHECIVAHVNGGAWSPDSVEQVRAAIRLFDFAAGENIAIEELTQEHVNAFRDLCEKMPNRWGKTRKELEHGLSASLEYAEELKAAGDGHRVGFSNKTVDKHITWIQAVLAFADDEGSGAGHRPCVPLRFKTQKSAIARKGDDKKKRSRDLRANWTLEEISRLLEAPIWHGTLSLDQRFLAGSEIYHDAFYWLPLMYILHGGRSSELAGLPLSDVFEDAEVPHFKVDYSDLRGLKNAQSIRHLPIHPELIRLGFIDYVKAMRDLGHGLLFPEMWSPRSKSFASTFYRSVFTKWRAWAFPNGTSWRHVDKGQIKDKDVHSFRGVASSLMKGKVQDSVRFDILGHEGGNTTASVYDEEASLEEKLKALRLVTPLTAAIQAQPLRLRPADRQKFGARRGAPRRK